MMAKQKQTKQSDGYQRGQQQGGEQGEDKLSFGD